MPLYAFGSNGSGQLGVGHTEDLPLPTKCFFAHDRDEQSAGEKLESGGEVVAISAGGNHTLVRFASGAVYATGSNASGRCAHGLGVVEKEKEGGLLRFSRVVVVDEEDRESGGKRRVDRFSAVAATWEASFLVDAETGTVYSVGAGAKGELGLGSAVTEAAVPMRIPDFPPAGTKVVALSSSGWHTVAVLSNGEVYGWGGARKGQLGKAGIQSKIRWSPTKIEDVGFPARQVACGREFTVVAGAPADGPIVILGSDKWDIQSAAPESLKGYATVSASWHGISVHNSDGSLLSWGRNDRGQLPPSDPLKLSRLAIGSEHVVAVTESMELVACGWGEHGNCGPTTDAQGNVKGQWAVIPFEDESIVKVGAGCATSWVVTD